MTIEAAMQARSPLSQSILADTLAVSRPSMVHTIDRLVKDGLVKREAAASDRRLKRIVVTDAGAHLYSLLRDEVAAVRRQMLAIVELGETCSSDRISRESAGTIAATFRSRFVGLIRTTARLPSLPWISSRNSVPLAVPPLRWTEATAPL